MNVKIRELRSEEFFLPTQLMLEESWTCLNEEYNEMFEKKLLNIKTTLVAADVETDEPLGVITWLKFRSDFCYVYLYIVRKNVRGKGVGSELWKEMLRRVGSDCNFGIDADEMLTKYRDRSGFVIQPSNSSSMHYRGNIEELRDYVRQLKLPEVKVEPLNESHLHKVAQMHKKAGGHLGREYWKELMQLRSTKSFVALENSRDVIGFISGVPDSNNGIRISPLYARSYELAMSLINILLNSIDDRKFDAVQLNVLNVNNKMLDLMHQLQYNIYYGEHRLYTKRDEGLTADLSIVFSRIIV